MEVPTAGIVTKVGTKVPMMLPTVLNAPKVPTVCPLSSRLSTEYFTREGVTVPSKNKGNTKITMQAANAAMMRKLLLTVKISSAEIPRIMYLPTTGIRAIQMAAIQDPAVEFVRVRGLVRTFTAVDIAQRHGDLDGADDNGPYDLGRTEIRCQQSAGSQFHRHDGHPGEELCEIQEQLIFQNS